VPLISFSLAVIFIIRRISTSAFRVPSMSETELWLLHTGYLLNWQVERRQTGMNGRFLGSFASKRVAKLASVSLYCWKASVLIGVYDVAVPAGSRAHVLTLFRFVAHLHRAVRLFETTAAAKVSASPRVYSQGWKLTIEQRTALFRPTRRSLLRCFDATQE